MTEPNDPLRVTGSLAVGEVTQGAQLDLTADAIVVESEAEGLQTFSAERGEYELKASKEAHKQRKELQQLESDLQEKVRRLDSELRR